MFIHKLAEVETPHIGYNTKVWRWAHICNGVIIGDNCMIGAQVYIGPDVTIGDGTRIQNNAFIPSGITIGKNCFIGPGVIFTNDRFPISDRKDTIKIGDNVVIGAGCVLVAGIEIGDGVKIGAGVTIRKSHYSTMGWHLGDNL